MFKGTVRKSHHSFCPTTTKQTFTVGTLRFQSTCTGCERFHGKARIGAEAKFYSLSKGGKWLIAREVLVQREVTMGVYKHLRC
jgi:hypothetical protein